MIIEAECRSNERAFEGRGVLVIPDEEISEAKRDLVHRAGNRNAFVLVTEPPAVLHGSELAGMQNVPDHADPRR